MTCCGAAAAAAAVGSWPSTLRGGGCAISWTGSASARRRASRHPRGSLRSPRPPDRPSALPIGAARLRPSHARGLPSLGPGPRYRPHPTRLCRRYRSTHPSSARRRGFRPNPARSAGGNPRSRLAPDRCRLTLGVPFFYEAMAGVKHQRSVGRSLFFFPCPRFSPSWTNGRTPTTYTSLVPSVFAFDNAGAAAHPWLTSSGYRPRDTFPF